MRQNKFSYKTEDETAATAAKKTGLPVSFEKGQSCFLVAVAAAPTL
jgi:hypothetical protein